MVSVPRFWGRLSAVGAGFAALTYLVDQVHKWYMISIFDISRHQPVEVMPGFDLVMVWNYGISYGWFASHSQAVRGILIVLSVVAAALLWLWLARQTRPFVAAAIGLVLGGALANATDRLLHGAVADFFHLYYAGFSWYVFNVADMAIVAGVLVLMYDSFTHEEKQTGM